MDLIRDIDVQCYGCIFRHIDNLAELLGMPFDLQRSCVEYVMHELLRTHGQSVSIVLLVKLATDRALSLMGFNTDFDPYEQLKVATNESVLKHQKSLSALIQGAEVPLAMALQLAAAGNWIDQGSFWHAPEKVEEILRSLPNRKFSNYHLDALYSSLITAKSLLFVCDNAGEIVLDRLLIEELDRHFPQIEVTCAVRHQPIVNDALMQDAMAVGLDQVANVLSSGSIYPGVFLEESSPLFQKYFDTADIIIAKGVGNFMTLSELRDQRLFFMFAVICPMIARLTNSEQGQVVLAHNN